MKSNILMMAANVAASVVGGGFDSDSAAVSQIAGNASILNSSYLSEPLTAYATGWSDGADTDAALDFLAPGVEVPRRFSYRTFANADAFMTDTDDIRGPRGDFKSIETFADEANGKTVHRGLKQIIDQDEMIEGWEERAVSNLLRRIKRSQLRRAIALLDAGAVNAAQTWNTSADPDALIEAQLQLAADASGVKPNRVAFGESAFVTRRTAFRAQNTAGSNRSSGFSASDLAAYLMVDEVQVIRNRMTSGTTRAQMLGNRVLQFYADAGATTEDASNAKLFYSKGEGGGRYQVYVRQASLTTWEVAVAHYELLALTSTLGLRKITVS